MEGVTAMSVSQAMGSSMAPTTQPATFQSIGSSDISILSPPSSTMNGMGLEHLHISMVESMADMSLEEAVARVQELAKENMQLQSTVVQMNSTIKNANQVLTHMKSAWEREREDVKDKYEQARNVVMILRKGVQEKDVRIESLQRQLDQTTKFGDARCTDSMNEEVKELYLDLTNSNIKVKQLEIENSQMKQEAQHLEAKFAKSHKDFSEMLTTKNELKVLSERLSAEKAQSAIQIARMEEQIQRIALERQDLLAMNNSLRTELHMCKAGSSAESSPGSYEEMLQDYVQVPASGEAEPQAESEEPATPSSELKIGQFSLGDDDEDLSATPEADRVSRGSTPRSSRDSQKLRQENVMSDLLVQMQEERNKTTELMDKIAELNISNELLQKKLHNKEQELIESRADMERRITESQHQHKQKEDQLQQQNEALSRELNYTKDQQVQMQQEDVQNLRAQVLSLVSELQQANQQLGTALETIEKYKERCQQLERKVEAMQKDLEEQRGKDDQLIATLSVTVKNLEANLAAERQDKAKKEKLLVDHRRQLEDMFTEAQKLTEKVEEYKLALEMYQKKEQAMSKDGGTVMVQLAWKRDIEEKVDNLMAQILCAEESMQRKADEMKTLKDQNKKLKEDNDAIAIYQAQAEVYKVDFEMEREARAQIHGEKQRLHEDLDQMRLQYQQLQDQMQAMSTDQIEEMQRRHAPPRQHQVVHAPYRPTATFPREAPARRDYYTQNEMPPNSPGRLHAQETARPADPVQPQRAPVQHRAEAMPDIFTDYECPKCGLKTPDIDSLQIHVEECIDL